MEDSYNKLLAAINNNDLYKYLTASGEYRIVSQELTGYDVNNDYRAVIRSINEYIKKNPDYTKKINSTLKEILHNNKLGEIYSVVSLIFLQLYHENNSKNTGIIDTELLELIKLKINQFKKEFSECKRYEGLFRNNGLYEIYEEWDDLLYNISGNRILK